MSKYDRFWQSIIDKVADLIKEAYVSSRSRKIDVSDLQMYGKRGNWYGSIIVSKNGIINGNMAHVRALGKIILKKGILNSYDEAVFRIKVTSNLKLDVNLINRKGLCNRELGEIAATKDLSLSPLKDTITSSKNVYFRIHELLEILPLRKIPIKLEELPGNGIYFFYEKGETINKGDKIIRRIVRVGTHREQNRFPRG